MDKDYINDLITRLRSSSTPPNLREEVIDVIKRHRSALEDVHISAKQNGDMSAAVVSGVALGKPGWTIGDAGF